MEYENYIAEADRPFGLLNKDQTDLNTPKQGNTPPQNSPKRKVNPPPAEQTYENEPLDIDDLLQEAMKKAQLFSEEQNAQLFNEEQNAYKVTPPENNINIESAHTIYPPSTIINFEENDRNAPLEIKTMENEKDNNNENVNNVINLSLIHI